jgi:hypothetical protein
VGIQQNDSIKRFSVNHVLKRKALVNDRWINILYVSEIYLYRITDPLHSSVFLLTITKMHDHIQMAHGRIKMNLLTWNLIFNK